MAMHSGVTSARAVSKPCSSPSLSRSSSTNKLVRRRGKGSLVRSRAFIWSKEDLQKLHELAKRPRHEVATDVIDDYTLSKSSSESHSPDNSTSSDLNDMNHKGQTTFAGAVDQQRSHSESSTPQNEPTCHSVCESTASTVQPPEACDAVHRRPPLYHMYHFNRALSERPQHLQLPAHSHHSVMPEPSATNPSNLALVSGITARLIDLAL